MDNNEDVEFEKAVEAAREERDAIVAKFKIERDAALERAVKSLSTIGLDAKTIKLLFA